jgi:hypothetical protein
MASNRLAIGSEKVSQQMGFIDDVDRGGVAECRGCRSHPPGCATITDGGVWLGLLTGC